METQNQAQNRAQSTGNGGDNPLDEEGLCLLSLDGGGVRGLSSLLILKAIMDKINIGLSSPVRPCEIFDLIGGTSTGGYVNLMHMLSNQTNSIVRLISIMLGRLGMDADECIEAYSDIMESIFGEPARSFPMDWRGNVRSHFDSAKLEAGIKKVLHARGVSDGDLLNDGVIRSCRRYVRHFFARSILEN